MNSTTTIDRVSDFLADSNERSLNYARSLGHVQGHALGAAHALQFLLTYNELDPAIASALQRVINNLQSAYTATQDPQAFGAANKI